MIIHNSGCEWETGPYCTCGADPDRTWEPGDPLFNRGASYQGYFYNFREQINEDECYCPDRARWPESDFSNRRLPSEEWFIAKFRKQAGLDG